MKFRMLKEDYTRTKTAKYHAKALRAARRYKGFAVAAMLLVMVLGAHAEDAGVSISAPMPIQAVKAAKHSNFNSYDYAIYAGVVASRAFDYYSTEHSIANGAHEVILPQCFVASKPGFAVYSFGMAALQIEGSVYLHKHGHAKLARLADTLSVSAGFAMDGHNMAQRGIR